MEGLCEASWAGDGFESSDKDGCGVVSGPGYDIEEPVNAVAEIDIPASWGTEHDGVARGLAPVSMGGFVEWAVISFCLGDTGDDNLVVDFATEVATE